MLNCKLYLSAHTTLMQGLVHDTSEVFSESNTLNKTLNFTFSGSRIGQQMERTQIYSGKKMT